MIVDDLSPSEAEERLREQRLSIRMGPLVFRVGTGLRELIGPLRLLYGGFPIAEEEAIVDSEIRVDALSGIRRFVAPRAVTLVDGQSIFAAYSRQQALPMFEWGVNWCVFTRPNRFLLLHSGVVERGGRGLLLSGKPGAGKSTLTAGLALRGWRLLSDEVAIVPPGTRRLVPIPRPVGLKDASIEVIRRFDASAVLGPACRETRKGTVAHLRPPADSLARFEETATAAWVIFPRYETGASTELTPVARAEALLRVGDEGFNYSMLGEVAFETLIQLIDGCECFDLRFGNLDHAVAAVNRLADRAGGLSVGGRQRETQC